MLLNKINFLSSLSTCKMCDDRTQLSHLNATLKVEYLFKMFEWHDVMVHDSRFSTPNSSVFLTPLRIIFIYQQHPQSILSSRSNLNCLLLHKL